MRMHIDKARQERLAGKIDHRRALRRWQARLIANRYDLSVFNDQRRIVGDLSGRWVDHAISSEIGLRRERGRRGDA